MITHLATFAKKLQVDIREVDSYQFETAVKNN